jgi:hypothetical protein
VYYGRASSKSLFKSEIKHITKEHGVRFSSGFLLLSIGFSCLLAGSTFSVAQSSAQPPPLTLTADQDHQNMMDQLGIKVLRPGPSGNEKAPNHANYDESLANPFPNVPDPLTANDGLKVTTAKLWWDQRRPELVELLSKYVYGRLPTHVPTVNWTVTAADHEMIGFTPVIAKDIVGQVDNSFYPAISVRIHMTLVTPASAKGPVPVLMMFGRAGFPAPNEPSAEELEHINSAWKAMLVQQDRLIRRVFVQYRLERRVALGQ